MSQGMYKEKINFLLYLDDPIQAEIADYLSELSPSRKGEVLRQIITTGWTSFKKQMNLEVETVTRVRKKPKPKAKPVKTQEPSAPSTPDEEADGNKQNSLASRIPKFQAHDKTGKEEDKETIASATVKEDTSDKEDGKEEQKDIRPIKKISNSPLIEDDEDDDEDDMSKLFGKIRSSH